MEPLKKIIIHHKSSHHAGYSGYAQLIKYIHPDKVITGKPSIPYRLAKLASKWYSDDAGLYDSNSVYKSIELGGLIKKVKSATVVHFLNGERDIRTLDGKNKIRYTATFHKPPSVLLNQITDLRYLRKLDSAICVGNNQVEFLKDWLGLDEVDYIPHGVDTDFFRPWTGKMEFSRPKILFVGQHLRDFNTFSRVINVILSKVPEVQVDVVLRREYIGKITLNRDVNVHSGINDDELRNLYQDASLLFLPLKDSTACNSILEALACGLPIVTTKVGGIMDYLEGGKNVIIDSDNYDDYVEVIVDLLNDYGKLNEIGNLNNQISKRFSWENIAHTIESHYEKLFRI